MRLKKLQPFDPTKEYAVGERCLYGDLVIIATQWTKWDTKLVAESPLCFTPRCVRCRIKREDCSALTCMCDKYRRTDRKTIYWRTVRQNKNQ